MNHNNLSKTKISLFDQSIIIPTTTTCMMDQEQQSHSSSRIPQISKPKIVIKYSSHHPVHKTLATAANLANLLPTGTVLAFRTLLPSFSNRGSCHQLSNKFLTASLIGFCAILCFFSSFTDIFVDCHGRFCYGIATFKGLYIFNNNIESGDDQETKREEEMKELSKFSISCIDFVHAFVSLFVFLVYAFSDTDVQSCFFDQAAGGNMDALVMNLPLAAGILSSFLFVIFPTTRRGIGYADLPSR